MGLRDIVFFFWNSLRDIVHIIFLYINYMKVLKLDLVYIMEMTLTVPDVRVPSRNLFRLLFKKIITIINIKL